MTKMSKNIEDCVLWKWCDKCKHYHWTNHTCLQALIAYAKVFS